MNFEIKARFTGKVLFTAALSDDLEPELQMRSALEAASTVLYREKLDGKRAQWMERANVVEKGANVVEKEPAS